MKYDAEYFIKFFEGIPDRKWCCHTYINAKGQKCAGAHVGENKCRPSKQSGCLLDIFFELLGCEVCEINDAAGDCPDNLRKFSRPRTRILHALREAKKRGY